MNQNIQKYLDLMKDVEKNLLLYIDENNKENVFFNYLDEQKINENKQKFKSFLYLIVNISNNYHRTGNFYNKIDQILLYYRKTIQNYYQNPEIFHIFQSNKRILLFLIQQKLIIMNQSIFDFFNQPKFNKKLYIEYFFPEVESFLPESVKNECKKKVKELNENNLEQFNEKRKIGENDNYICSLIRNDQVIDFITHLEKNNISPSSYIDKSIYETNHFLLTNNDKVSLIQYSAYFGAQQIFVYLNRRGVELTSNIWKYVIHGKNAHLIHLLEENHIKTISDSYQYLVIEAIKCHHDEITDYFQLNFCQNEQMYDEYLLKKHLKYHNFNLKNYNAQKIIQLSTNSDLFYFLCKYDFAFVVEEILSINEVNINQQYEIYKPLKNLKDIILSISIKNGEIDQQLEDLKMRQFMKYIKQPIPNEEYKDGFNYLIYNYDQEVMTALHIATRKGNIDIVRLLLNNKKIETDIHSRLYSKSETLAPFNGYFTILEKRTLLHEAICGGHVDIVQMLLSAKTVNIDDNLIYEKDYIDSISSARTHIKEEDHKTTFVLAAESGYCDIMQFLITQRKDYINQKSFGVQEISGGCISFSTTIRRSEKTPLHAAIQKANYNIVKIFLDQPEIDISIPFVILELDEYDFYNFQNNFDKKSGKIKTKMSTLYLAVSNSNIDIVRLLLDNPKNDINMKSILPSDKFIYNNKIRTALHEAVINKQIEIIKLLLQQKNIDINIVDENQKKPVDYADEERIKEFFWK